MLAGRIERCLWAGNSEADDYANRGAALHEPDMNTRNAVNHYDIRAWLIQRRLVHARLASATAARRTHVRVPQHQPVARTKLEDCHLEELGHSFMKRPTNVRCKWCHLKVPMRETCIARAVQQGQCPGPRADFRQAGDESVPWKVHLPITRFLDKAVHPSHQYGLKRGLLWCWTCGAYAAERVVGLAKPCPGQAGPGGAGQLRRLKEGKTPSASVPWPLPEPDVETLLQARVMPSSQSESLNSGSPAEAAMDPASSPDQESGGFVWALMTLTEGAVRGPE